MASQKSNQCASLAAAAAAAASAASSSSQLNPVSTTASFTERIRSDDPTLWFLKLYQAPLDHFEYFSEFVEAIKCNRSITHVEVTWRFLRGLKDFARISLLQTVGTLPRLVEFALEGVGPTAVLTVALQNAGNLKSLRVGKLRFSSNQDVLELANSFRHCTSLQQLSLSSIQVTIEGSHRVDAEGMVWFDENRSNTEKIQLDPIFEAVATIPTLVHIQLQHCLNDSRVQPLNDRSLQLLCHAPRKSLVLNACGLTDEKCFVIADELKHNDNPLASLVVTRNYQVTGLGWDAFVKMLSANCYIVDMHTGAEGQTNEPSIEVRAKMDYFLKLNRAGRGKLLLQGKNHSKEEWLEFIIRRSYDIDIVFFALQTNPILCSAYSS